MDKFLRNVMEFVSWAVSKVRLKYFDQEPAGRIPFDFISGRLRTAVRQSSDKVGKKVIVPNSYTLCFSPEDRASRKHIEAVFVKELQNIAKAEIDKCRGIITGGPLSVNVLTDTSLKQGSFYIDCKYVENRPEKIWDKASRPAVRKEQEDLSATCIPPSSHRDVVNGDLYRTILENAQSDSEFKCRIDVEDSEGHRIVYLPMGTYMAGRGASADIKLNRDDLKISREHICFDIAKERIAVRVIGKNGCEVNGRPVSQGGECEAVSGDRVNISEAVMTLKIEKV